MATAKIRFETADQYISSFSKDVQKILRVVQKTIQSAVPGAEEMISYQIPAFKYNGSWIFYYSAYTSHYSLSCPMLDIVFEKFKKELSEYKVSKSAIQFSFDKSVPVKLIAAMAKFRAAQPVVKMKPKAK